MGYVLLTLSFPSPVTCLLGTPSPFGSLRTSFSANLKHVGVERRHRKKANIFWAFDFEAYDRVKGVFPL